MQILFTLSLKNHFQYHLQSTDKNYENFLQKFYWALFRHVIDIFFEYTKNIYFDLLLATFKLEKQFLLFFRNKCTFREKPP